MSFSCSVCVPGDPLIDDEALLELLRLVVVFDGDVFLLADFVAADSFRPPAWTVDLCRQKRFSAHGSLVVLAAKIQFQRIWIFAIVAILDAATALGSLVITALSHAYISYAYF